MYTVQWNLKGYLKAHNLTPHRLVRAIPGIRQATIYRLVAEDAPQSVSFEVMTQVLNGLRTLTGQEVTPNDLMVLVPDLDDEDAAWLAADFSGLAQEEPYAWGDVDPLTLGQPVHVTGSGEIVIGEP